MGLLGARLRLGSEGRVSRGGTPLPQGRAVPQSQDLLLGTRPRPGHCFGQCIWACQAREARGWGGPLRTGVAQLVQKHLRDRDWVWTHLSLEATTWGPVVLLPSSCLNLHHPHLRFPGIFSCRALLKSNGATEKAAAAPSWRGKLPTTPVWGTLPCSPEELPGLLDSGLHQGLGHFLCRGSGPIW